uniref:Cation/H+ exchanger domain-containing protein n=2 Tax=Chenopodium quinoa TaxID=63459 RepID=A0A803MIZ3_CHEQI
MILFLVLACGLLTDYLGCHFIFGAYVLGRIIPPGNLAKTLIEKMEDCVDGVLMPLYFVVLGIGVDIFIILVNSKYVLVIILAVATKVLCTLLIGIFCDVPLVDGFPLGILLSSKGFFPLVLLNIGRQRKILSGDSYTLLFVTIFLSTILVEPIMKIICKRIRKNPQLYDQRSLQGANFSEKLKLITCHAPAMLVEHESQRSFFWNLGSKLFCDRGRAESDQIIKQFNEYTDQHDNSTSSLKVFTVVSPINTMHEDICSLAMDKHASLIILPFHKQQGVDGKLEDTNIEFGGVNQNVLDVAPCSVALLVDRGLRVNSMSSSSEIYSDDGQGCEQIQIAMIYIGGCDDREALTYAWRMAGHSSVNLTVIRFLEGEKLTDFDQPIDYINFGDNDIEVENLTISAQKSREIQVDNEFLMDFQEQNSYDRSICYLEKFINCPGEIITSLREMGHDFDLYMVGKGQSRLSFPTIGLVKWSEFKELGPITDILITSEFTSTASVLVMQQYSNKLSQKNFVVRSTEEEKVTIISS